MAKNKTAAMQSRRKAPTLEDIARLSDVSKMTVSLVLRGSNSRAAPATRERIFKFSRKLGYTPNIAARRLAQQKNNLVGVMTSGLTNITHSMKAEAVIKMAVEKGYEPLLWLYDGTVASAKKMCDIFLSNRVAGVLLVAGFDPAYVGLRALVDRGVPIVSVDGGDLFRGGGTDRFQAFYDLTVHLLDLGHKRFAYVGPDNPHLQFQDRIDGIRAAVHENSNTNVMEWLKVSLSPVGTPGLHAGVRGAELFLAGKSQATAIICFADVAAFGLISHLGGAGVRIPEDVAVVSFDGLPEAAYFSPSLTTVEQPVEEIARVAWEYLEESLQGPAAALGVDYKKIAGRLVRRESSGSGLQSP